MASDATKKRRVATSQASWRVSQIPDRKPSEEIPSLPNQPRRKLGGARGNGRKTVPVTTTAVLVAFATLVCVWLILSVVILEGPSLGTEAVGKVENRRDQPSSVKDRLKGGLVHLRRIRIDPGQRLRGVEQKIDERFQNAGNAVRHEFHEIEHKVEEIAAGAMRNAEDVVAEVEEIGEKLGRKMADVVAEKQAKLALKVWAGDFAESPAQIYDNPVWGKNSPELIDMRLLDAHLPFENPDGGAWKQGWDLEPRSLDPLKPLKIFVVPHSHCDPGWIKTFDDYFQSQTKGILTNVYEALLKDDRRRFIWAEISYFEWWWREQTSLVQQDMRKLIKEKRFEFVTGGWVQPDEANTQRYAIEIQLQEGRDWLNSTFGPEILPEYGWSIDPFGYSATMADILKEYGFKGMLIQRVHYAVKKELAKRKHLEFMWRQTWDKVGSRDIFTHVMPFYSYDVPHTCGPDPSVCCQFDFGRLRNRNGGCPWHIPPQEITPRNVAQRAQLILDQWQKKATLYRGDAVLVPLGDDFRYGSVEETEAQFRNFQLIFDYLNDKVPGVEARFGTLSDYFNAIEGKFEPPVLKGSFFTYADRNEDYWSGYFTSRAFDKALDRRLERSLFAAESRGATVEEMREPRRALSLFQHHDGVTGTAKNHVVEDYARRMHEAIDFVQGWTAQSVNIELRNDKNATNNLRPCWKSKAPRDVGSNMCNPSYPTFAYNPISSEQRCGHTVVPPQSLVAISLPCDTVGFPPGSGKSLTNGEEVQFDPTTGMMTHPIRERWMVWKVTQGGAYLFFPGTLEEMDLTEAKVEAGGYMVSTPLWRRKVIERNVPDEFNRNGATVFDFIFETKLIENNREWFVRFTSDVSNGGIFHTDLNGFNFDTHHFRADLPIQSQVFPMPTHASIQDDSLRLTVLSEHSQGTASLSDGTIDVWLDRRLQQDDNRGLSQGVQDNVKTRTRLRVMVEKEGYDPDPGSEFNITSLCRRMWDELDHPLELFGTHRKEVGALVSQDKTNRAEERTLSNAEHPESKAKKIVPFVFMVHKRVDYLRRAIDSLLASDFPRSRVPLIISHDGHVPEVMSFVDSLKQKFNVVQIFHPFSCYDEPNSFPAKDESLNENYDGDTYGNERSPWATCAKHHWVWMMRTVWDMDFGIEGVNIDDMLFMEEDYIVSQNIYDTVITGLDLSSDPEYFGITLDITNGGIDPMISEEGWVPCMFRTGPMAIPRRSWEAIRSQREIFCTFDEYNWDWSVVNLQFQLPGVVPKLVLAPSFPQVRHIGVEGMHVNSNTNEKTIKTLAEVAKKSVKMTPFRGKGISRGIKFRDFPYAGRGNGGWGHPKDHQHCLEIMGV